LYGVLTNCPPIGISQRIPCHALGGPPNHGLSRRRAPSRTGKERNGAPEQCAGSRSLGLARQSLGQRLGGADAGIAGEPGPEV
jgi:hypothetical protein